MHRPGSKALIFGIAIAIGVILVGTPTISNSTTGPGATVRNIFGPQSGNAAAQCRGACGADCPDSCSKSVSYECTAGDQMRRVVTYACGTHQGCREHDACLDACRQTAGADSGSCQQQCDATAMEDYGFDSASWLLGKGPFDGEISFEYTRNAPNALEPAFACPTGTTQQCAASAGCVASNGARVEPVFSAYPQAAAGGMRVSEFKTGPACGNSVCEQSSNIRVTGNETCASGSCTRFGMEFDYENADPSAPLECSTSTSGGGSDFIGDLIKLGADANVSRSADAPKKQDDGMAELLGMFSKVVASADSPEDLNVSIAPLDEDGNPVESERKQMGGEGPPPIPRSVALPAARGHLFVPMYQLSDSSVKAGKERTIRCTHKGTPVLETTFRLQAG